MGRNTIGSIMSMIDPYRSPDTWTAWDIVVQNQFAEDPKKFGSLHGYAFHIRDFPAGDKFIKAAYIQIPKDHVFYEQSYFEIEEKIGLELSFSGYLFGPRGDYYIGFDMSGKEYYDLTRQVYEYILKVILAIDKANIIHNT